MNNFQLKILAIFLMTIDHIGYVLFPDIVLLRIIGRLSFPIFVFLIIEGYKHTSNYKNFLTRLVLFALIIEIPNFIFNYSSSMNIFFTLATGLITVKILDIRKSRWLIPFIMVITSLLHFDYSTYGVLLFILFFHLQKFEFSFLNKFLIIVLFHLCLQIPLVSTIINFNSNIQFYAIFSFVFISYYNGKKGYNSKFMQYFFYFYYPVHFMILSLISFLYN